MLHTLLGRITIAAISAIGLALIFGPVYGHGFGERYDLPVPLNYFIVGAAATVALSFVLIGLFIRVHQEGFRYPTYNLLSAPLFSSALTNRLVISAIKAASTALFLMVTSASLFGVNKPIDNLAPAFVWIIWWVGMGYLAALVGNVWVLLNPWKTIYEWIELISVSDDKRHEGMFRYPDGWGRWPGVIIFLVFGWIENVYANAAEPSKLGVLIILYSLVTWSGMAFFGKHRWLQNGEVFSILFATFSRFSPTELRQRNNLICHECDFGCSRSEKLCVDCHYCFEQAQASERELNLRPYGVGLVHIPKTSTASTVFVILVLSIVSFDGLTSTPLWTNIQSAGVQSLPFLGKNSAKMMDTVGLVLLPTVFLSIYLMFCRFIKSLSREQGTVWDVARGFVYGLVPIAIAYNLSHYISLLVIQGQLIIPLASDPFGFGWDLFGTGDYRLNIKIVNAKFVWFLSVTSIVLGHIIAVYISHIVSLLRISDRSLALKGQYPMLALMVGYTATSLWIIAQPIIE